MKKWVNGDYVEMTEEELAQMNAQAEQAEREYWATISYEDAVNDKIREKYSASQEFAILRQKEEKPQEYNEYYAYCEQCKAYVKEKKGL